MAFLHGIKINEPLTGATLALTALSAVIGIVATASDADATVFPLDRPVLITDVNAAIGKAGVEGTLAKTLGEIANHGSPIVVAVRVATAAAGAMDDNVVGTRVDNAYTGLQALLAAEGQVGVRPRIIGCPGLDTEVVATAIAIVARKLRGFAYVQCEGDSVAEALLYREKFASRELMGLWPEWTGGPVGTWSGKAVAVALGQRAAIDEAVGWHQGISNVAVAGVTGMSKDVNFDLQDMSTDAGLLNAGHVTTLINLNGRRFWGNRTFSDEPQFAFEVAVRTSQAIQDIIATTLARFVDKPMTKGLVGDIVETVNAQLRQWSGEGRLVGGTCWYDPASNAEAALSAGRLVIDYDFTPCAPLEGLELNQRITDKYYAGFADNIAA
jgi:phage tail sheath protein FI